MIFKKKKNTTKNVKKKLLKIKKTQNSRKKKIKKINSININYKNKKDNILALKEQVFMNRMINTPIMK